MTRAALAAALVLLAGSVSGCSLGFAPDLIGGGVSTSPGPIFGGESMGGVPRRMSVSPDSWVCGVTDVPIDSVELLHPSDNIHLVRWAVDNRLVYTREGSAHGALTNLPTFQGHTVKIRCRTSGGPAYAAIGVEVLRDDDAVGSFDGLTLHYGSGGVAKTVYIPVQITLCSTSCPDPDK